MLLSGLGRFVGMASVACILSIAGNMADLAINFTLVTMVNRKRMLAELGRRPGQRCMATDTILAKRAGMDFGLQMAAGALIWCAGED